MMHFSLSPVFCAHNGVLLLKQSENSIVVGLLNMHDERIRDKIESRYRQYLQQSLGDDAPNDIHKNIRYTCISKDFFIRKTAKEFSVYQEQLPATSAKESGNEKENENLAYLIYDAPIIHLLNSLLLECIEKKGSDIHIEPFRDGSRVKMRFLGELEMYSILDSKTAGALILRILFLSGLDISEERKSQDGSFHFKAGTIESEVRVSVLPSYYGLACVLRILTTTDFKQSFEELGFTPSHQDFLENACRKSNSLVLVCGATGAGKSTTLAAMLYSIRETRKKIISIEDPVEYRLDGVVQIPVNQKLEMDFSDVLRSTFRHDPDVIMVGEIRDEKTARIAVRAALTGHLVLATLHTLDAPSAIIRLLDMGIENWLLESVYGGAICQRLVKKYTDSELNYIPIAEVLPSCSDVSSLILKKASLFEYRKWMEENNIISLREEEEYATCI